VVDWSSESRPKTGLDSIWIARATRDGLDEPVNAPTRAAARVRLQRLLLTASEAGRRVLVGIDFPYGYPRGLARALGLTGPEPPWLQVWHELGRVIEDDERNVNNRFDVAARFNVRIHDGPGPFWGCPAGRARRTLTVGKPPASHGLPDLRSTERALRGVQPAWKLSYPGSVGGQALVGIPVVRALRFAAGLADRSQVWPFETGFAAPTKPILHVEIWPGVGAPDPSRDPIKDAHQVLTLARELARLDEAGGLGELLGSTPLEERLGPIMSEEGWILGAGRGPLSQ
jgi:hypothetical protein